MSGWSILGISNPRPVQAETVSDGVMYRRQGLLWQPIPIWLSRFVTPRRALPGQGRHRQACCPSTQAPQFREHPHVESHNDPDEACSPTPGPTLKEPTSLVTCSRTRTQVSGLRNFFSLLLSLRPASVVPPPELRCFLRFACYAARHALVPVSTEL